MSFTSVLSLLFAAQAIAMVILLRRLARGRHRLPPGEPLLAGLDDTTVAAIVPVRNEERRITPCLAGLREQGPPLVQVVVVDGQSSDGTADIVRRAAAQDARIRLIDEPPRPPGAVGRPWAIEAGVRYADGEWLMVMDADVVPRPGMVAGAVAAARRHGYDAVSFAPRIVAPTAGARLLQPALLTTLVYRFGAPGSDATAAERQVANGQCLLVRKAALEEAGGYGVVRDSFCDDVRIARHLAGAGLRVGFLDGPLLLDVLMYRSAAATWRGWPSSLHMRDATGAWWRWLDALLLVLTQALPVPLLAYLIWRALAGVGDGGAGRTAALSAGVTINAILLATRALLLVATAPAFVPRGIWYWLSPIADVPAALRVVAGMAMRPREWRGTGSGR